MWVAGDLINRGPRSLDTLRFLRSLGSSAKCILGNHDLHLLAVVHGARPVTDQDTFEDVLAAPDRDDLVEWLTTRPLLVRDQALGFTMVHAGLIPQWTSAQAAERASELEAMLRSSRATEYFRHMYGNGPDMWRDDLAGWDRLRYITNVLTRLRYCRPNGSLEMEFKGPPGTQPDGYYPWFSAPGRASAGERIAFGHWATLTLSPRESESLDVFHLDTGCVWGGHLTALNLETLTYTSEPSQPDDLRRS